MRGALAGEQLGPAIWLLAVGKASAGMAAAAAAVLGTRVKGGLVIVPGATPIRSSIPNVDIVAGGHPVPTADSERAGRRALALAESIPSDGRFLVLISGGASALMAVPVPPITLEDKQRTTERLLRNGADIHALNTVRKHLSAIKGGQLAARSKAPCTTLVISDVVGDDLSVIGSGPTVGDSSTFRDAYDALQKYGDVAGFPDHVTAHIRAGMEGDRAETPRADALLRWNHAPRGTEHTQVVGKIRDGVPVGKFVDGARKSGDLTEADARVIGSRATAMEGAAAEARRCGFHVVEIEEPVVGDARTAAAAYASRIRSLASHDPRRPLCVISSGETTVHVKGTGTGGRNQEFALALSGAMAGARLDWAAASVGTDGVDGPTDAAGAVVDRGTPERAAPAGLAPARAFLDDNNAYAFFDATGDLIKTGPTGTNVGDIQVILLA